MTRSEAEAFGKAFGTAFGTASFGSTGGSGGGNGGSPTCWTCRQSDHINKDCPRRGDAHKRRRQNPPKRWAPTSQPPEPTTPAPRRVLPAPTPPGLSAHWSEGKRQWYYFNAQDGLSQWVPPEFT